jgi:hypothetical protein
MVVRVTAEAYSIITYLRHVGTRHTDPFAKIPPAPPGVGSHFPVGRHAVDQKCRNARNEATASGNAALTAPEKR